ncbi:MAG: AarF/UbiB family protein [Haloferula sp.]
MLGQRLAHMMYRQIFELHAVHADPNPANFAFRKTGDIVIISRREDLTLHVEPRS